MKEFTENNSKEAPISPKEKLIADKFLVLVDKGKFDDLVLTIDNINVIKKTILDHKARLAPGDFSIDEVIKELIKIGRIKPIEVPKKITEDKKETEIYKIDTETLKGVTRAEFSEEQLRIIDANLLYEEVHKRKIFKNSEDLNEIHEKALTLGESKGSETIENYLEFAKAGLIKPKGLLTPEEVVDKDFKSIGEKQHQFAEEAPKDHISYKKYIEAKKIATMVERCLAYCCTNGWYGERVRIVLTSLFDDIRRGVDEVFLIEKDNEKHDVLGLGVDATYRGLKSDLFKQKFFTLLGSIKDGYKTKIKYFKDHNGKMMREFSIPKIILHFDIEDVKEFVDILKSVGEEGEKEKILNSYLKSKVMNQIINSCKIMAKFAEESQNSIFRDYYNVLNSIKELSWENEDMQELLKVDENDEVSQYYKKLIKEFEDLEITKLK